MLVGLTAVVFLTMLVEAGRAARNERAQRARGGIEPEGDIYPVMRIAYPAIFVAMLLEAAWTSRPVSPGLFAAGAVMFVLAKALKWAAVAALGPAWTFRVIVVPGAPLVEGGPYRYVRHPNYVGVLGEIAGVALMTGAMVSGPLSLVVFGAILARRLIVEGRALSLAGAVPADERP